MSSADEPRIGEARGLRKGRPLLAGRDTPVFTQMRRNQTRPTRQEFFTESTNTSYIPSPSPVRSTGLSKPRQTLNNSAKASNGAYRATFVDKEKEKEDAPVDSTPSTTEERSRSRAPSTKRSPVHISAAGSPQPIARADSSNRASARTPSPRRGREERLELVSPASFISESSEPPYALPEIYRRIEDEELIAGAGSDVSSSTKGSPEHSRIKRLSLSPIGPRASSTRRQSPSPLAGEAETSEGKLAGTRSPPGSSPETTASSSFEETIETDPEMLARDERRLKEMIASNARAFAKARKGKTSLTVENLLRQEDVHDPKESSASQSQSSGKKSQEPGINVPWAKAKRDRRWHEAVIGTRAIAPAETVTAQARGVNGVAEHEKAAKTVKDWLRDAEASPIVEAEQQTSNARLEESKHPLRERISFDKARQWETQRLNETLSPPRTAPSLAALRERSMERLQQSAVTSNVLGARNDARPIQRRVRGPTSQQGEEQTISPRESSTALRAQMSPEGLSSIQAADSARMDSNPAATTANKAIGVPRIAEPEGPVSPEVAKQLAFAAASQPKGTLDSRDLLRQFSRASSASPVGNKRTSPNASSQSDASEGKKPSPLSLQAGSISKPTTELTDPQGKTENSAPQKRLAGFDVPKSSMPSGFQIETIAQEGSLSARDKEPRSLPAIEEDLAKVEASKKLLQEADNVASEKSPELALHKDRPTDGKTKDEVPLALKVEAGSKGDELSQTPQVPAKGPYLKTPKVTGAWIDTPIATAKRLGIIPEHITDPAEEYNEQSLLDAAKVVLGTDRAQRVGPSLKKKSKRDLESLAQTAPALPGSALAAIIDHAKRRNRGEEASEGEETLQLDEATIRSLEKLLVKDERGSGELESSSKPSRDVETSSKDASGPSQNANALKKITSDPSDSPSQSTSARVTVNTSQSGKRATSDPLPATSHTRKSSLKPALSLAISDSPKQPQRKKPKKSVAVLAPSETCDQAGEFHDFIWPCDACRARARAAVSAEDESLGVVQWQTLSIPRLWTHSPRSSRSWLPCPTNLGWLLLVVGICWWAEKTVASYYTPPFYAWKMEGFGVDYHMVRPPFVIPKLIWRGPAGAAVRWVWWLVTSLVHVIAGAFGVDLRVFDEAPQMQRPKVEYTFRPAYETVGGELPIRDGRWP